MKWTFNLLGFITYELTNLTGLGVVAWTLLAAVSNLLVGGLVVWGGSWFLSTFVTTFTIPWLGFVESLVLFGVVSFVAGTFKAVLK